jgi:hypothetical protein
MRTALVFIVTLAALPVRAQSILSDVPLPPGFVIKGASGFPSRGSARASPSAPSRRAPVELARP